MIKNYYIEYLWNVSFWLAWLGTMLSKLGLLMLTVPCEVGDLHKTMTNCLHYLYKGHVTLALSTHIIC